MRKDTHGTRAGFHWTRFEDTLSGRGQEESCAASFEIVVQINEEGQTGVHRGIRVVDVRRWQRRGVECGGGPRTVNLNIQLCQ